MAKNNKKTSKRFALNKFYYPKSKAELCDFDYLSKLSPEELEWLNLFMEEWAKARLNHGKEKLHSEKHKKEIYHNNNARNRDVWNKFSRNDTGNISPETILDFLISTSDMDYEEIFIEQLDKKKKKT